MSGNTMGAELFSDSKFVASMLPDFPKITSCVKCKYIFWINDAEKCGSLEYGERKKFRWRKSVEAKFLTIDENFYAIENKIFKPGFDELFFRKNILWGFNDRIRNKIRMFESKEKRDINNYKSELEKEMFHSEEDRSQWLSNINRLKELFNYDVIEERIFIAELYRNLGDFDKCIEIIKSIDEEKKKILLAAFVNECYNKNPFVFLLSPYY
ncbi:MAG: hypothetical protein WAT71_11315 [Ignavibacteria bacterium]